ncbi:Uncharacterized protein APZ42_002348, partial [Daphnia magna]
DLSTLAIVTVFIGNSANFISMAKRKRSSNPRAGTSHDDEYMPMMDDVMLSSTPFKTYGNDSSTAQDSHEESEDSESDINISGRSSRLSNNSKARGPKKRSPIWKFFDTSGEGKQLKTKCNLTKI